MKFYILEKLYYIYKNKNILLSLNRYLYLQKRSILKRPFWLLIKIEDSMDFGEGNVSGESGISQ